MRSDFISMSEASKICPYKQGYLSLLARRGQLSAVKKDNVWYTKKEWINEYLKDKRPDKVILENEFLNNSKRFFKHFVWVSFLFIGFLFIANYFIKISHSQIAVDEKFETEEILKIPNEKGGYDTYLSGKMKVE